jgi:type IV pilus assembly protein PilB
MTNEQIISLIQSQNLLAPEALTKIKREASLSGRGVEEIIHEGRLIDDDRMAELKATYLKIPYQKLDLEALTSEVMALVPEETVRSYGIVPIEKRDGLLIAGMTNPDDNKAQEALKFVARRERLNLGVYVISYNDWQMALRKYSPYKSSMAAAVKSLNLKPGGRGGGVELEKVGAGEDAPVIRIVADTLREAVQAGASDVHLEPQQNYLRVRFRIGGDLEEAASLPAELSQPVISRVKVMSNLRIDETRVPQDGRFHAKILDRDIDFRVSTFPTPLGEKMAIRVLDPQTGLKTLDELGLSGTNLQTVKTGIAKPFGMVLISGPTGSGKSTTLYALLQLLNNEKVNIVSLEDPVEYFVSGVNQSQVRPEINYDFASGLREILRQDPDVIMVGEIRDNETAGLAIHAALTGHIVLSTIHTNNAVGVLPRLIDMSVEPFILSEAVNLMISQRLISKLCDSCKVAADAPEDAQTAIAEAMKGVPAEVREKYKAPYKIYHGQGCAKCKNKGTLGRMAIFEVFQMTRELAEIVAGSDRSSSKILAEAKRQGMITMREDGIVKALDGQVALEEVLRETAE